MLSKLNHRYMRLSSKEFIAFLEEWMILLNSKIGVIDSLKAICETINNKKVRSIIISIVIDLEQGTSIVVAMQKFPRAFPVLALQMLKIAENTDSFIEIVNKMYLYYSQNKKAVNKVKSATLYPKILCLVCLATIVVLGLVVLPSFERMFITLNTELPLITRILIGFSRFLREYCVWIVIMVGLLIVVYFILSRCKGFVRFKDYLKINLPIIKQFYDVVVLSRFIEMFTTMIESNLSIINALSHAKGVLKNVHYEDAISKVILAIKEGEPFAEALKVEQLFPYSMVNMLAIGEKSGNLEQSLGYVSKYYREKFFTSMNKLVTYIEPIMIIVIAGIIALVMAGIFLPLLKMMDTTTIGGMK